MLHTGMWAIGPGITSALKTRQPVERVSRKDVGNPLFNFYQTSDSSWLQLVMIESKRFWDGFCKALGFVEFAADPKFNTHVKRVEHSHELVEIIENKLFSENIEHLAARLDDPQVHANSYTTTLAHAEEGDFNILTASIKVRANSGNTNFHRPRAWPGHRGYAAEARLHLG